MAWFCFDQRIAARPAVIHHKYIDMAIQRQRNSTFLGKYRVLSGGKPLDTTDESLLRRKWRFTRRKLGVWKLTAENWREFRKGWKNPVRYLPVGRPSRMT
jgi:hypothetical protein